MAISNRYRFAAPMMSYAADYAMRMAAPRKTGYRSGQSWSVSQNYKKRKTKANRNSFKAKVLAIKPAKHYTLESAFNTLHNVIYGCIPTQGIVQGDGNSNREGDRIYLMALKFNITSHSDVAAAAYVYRVIIEYSGEEYTAAGLGTGFVSGAGGPALGELFLPTTSTLAATNGIINPKAFTCVYDRVYDVNSQVTGAKDGVSISDTVQLNTDFSYQASASIQGKTRNLVMLVIATVNNGVTNTTATGDSAVSVDVIFK